VIILNFHPKSALSFALVVNSSCTWILAPLFKNVYGFLSAQSLFAACFIAFIITEFNEDSMWVVFYDVELEAKALVTKDLSL